VFVFIDGWLHDWWLWTVSHSLEKRLLIGRGTLFMLLFGVTVLWTNPALFEMAGEKFGWWV
jgi:hypothetical protein